MPNRLASATSPYLQQHAGNPVDWYPWGEEALERAARENKPIFLSIGYSTCHWCHVMARESFEDPAIAAYLNEHYVSIKVDREERPDVDRVYMAYVQAVTGHGGWPLNVWLTPERKPFFGGTYFPPEDRPGAKGFRGLLEAIVKGWTDHPDTLLQEGNRVIAALAMSVRNAASPEETEPATGDLVDRAGNAFEKCFQHLYEHFDADHGGFGGAPKFPRASNLNFLLRAAAIQGPETEAGSEALAMVTTTLQAMARGGIHDQVGGGFHRYSVDAAWHVPHFEKMLPDQAQIAGNFLDAQVATGVPTYGHFARRTLDSMIRDFGAVEGGFCSALDAESDFSSGSVRIEGGYYFWTKAEIDVLTGADAPLICAHFDVLEAGNLPEEFNHLGASKANLPRQVRPLSDTAQLFGISIGEADERITRASAALARARASRPAPARDEKIVAGWNGLALSALARAACILDEDTYRTRALHLAEFLYSRMHDAGTGILFRSLCGRVVSGPGFAEDYAAVIQGLLDLYEATFEARWLVWAEKLQVKMDELFRDRTRGGYFATAPNDPYLVLRLKEDHDGAEPSANSLAAMNLFRFRAFLPMEEQWDTRGREVLEGLRSQWEAHPEAVPQLLCALECALASPKQVVLVGAPDDALFRAMNRALATTFGPLCARLAVTGRDADEILLKRIPYLREYSPVPGKTVAYVCEQYRCLAPAETVEALVQTLRA